MKNPISSENAWQTYENADCLYTQSEIQHAIEQMATAITQELSEKNPLVISIMNGGLVLTGQLLPRLHFPLVLDYLHASRYRGDTSGHADLIWTKKPQFSLQDRVVLLVDDILDEGYTLKEVQAYCHQEGAKAVYSAVLLEKHHERRVEGVQLDFAALPVEDRYVFGCGMDYQHYLRNLDGVYALKRALKSC